MAATESTDPDSADGFGVCVLLVRVRGTSGMTPFSVDAVTSGLAVVVVPALLELPVLVVPGLSTPGRRRAAMRRRWGRPR